MSVTPQEAAKRLAEAGLSFQDRYTSGATGKGGKWVSAASAAEANYKEGVASAISKSAFSKGVSAAGASAYDTGIRDNADRWGDGMGKAESAFLKGVAPFTNLWGSALSTARGAKRSAANLRRMTENVERFVKAKG